MIWGSLSRIPPDTLAGGLLRLPLRLLARDRVMTVRSGVNKGLQWIAGASVHGCWLGHYESEKQRILEGLVRPGMVAYDIGANAGFYTLAFSRLVGPSGQVWAFEPFPENAANLLRHLELNRVSNATLLQAAVSDRTELARFQAGPNNSAGKLGSGAAGHALITASLDELIERHGLPSPDIVKMDVEGAEGQVLAGARKLLRIRTTTFLIALHGDKPMRDCIAILEEHGYEVRAMDGTRITAASPFVDEVVARTPRP
jgi:FkbM family methyltransferase